ncbi:hypothetical protein SAZ11_56195 [Streptomyces sp. FXJ1.4098]|nr:hypothetical protein [Streptomyces sp. FXJ1.4098]
MDLRERPELLLVPAVFVIAMLVWEFAVPAFGVDDYLLPRPPRSSTPCGHNWPTRCSGDI